MEGLHPVTVADLLAAAMASRGVGRVYGLPGEDHLELLDAFDRAGIVYVPTVNETSAAIMAATEADASSIPGVCLLSMAAGVSNAINGILHAHMEELPLVVVSGQRPPEALPMLVRQGFDFESLLRPVVKWSARADAGSDVGLLVHKAMHQAASGKPGPVYLEVASSVAAAAPVAERRPVPPVARWDRPMPGVSGADPQGLETLAAGLAEASRPVLVVGGRTPPDAAESIARFAETLRCPVLTTPKRIGMLQDGHPFDGGTFLNGNLEERLIGRSDLIVMTDPVAFDYYNRRWPYAVEPDLLCSADEHVEHRLPFRSAVVGPIPVLLEGLAAAVTASSSSVWTTDDVAAYRASVRDTLLGSAAGLGFTVAGAVDAALRSRVPGAQLVADAGFTKPLALMLQDVSSPDRFFGSNALSTMGFAVPAALALSRAGIGPVLALVGDGSLLMRASELALHDGLSHPVAIVASIDMALTQIRVKQLRQHLEGVGTALPDLSCADIGRAFGIPGRDVSSPEELAEAVADVWESDAVPHLIGAHVDPGSSQQMFELLRG
jgi:acetolactate synthase I/II/III large subunit